MSFSIHRMDLWIKRSLIAKDYRTRLVNDTLTKIKHIKLYGWEAAIEQKLQAARVEEVKTYKGMAIHNAVFASTMSAMPNMLTFIAFSILKLQDGGFDAQLVFPCMTLFSMVNSYMSKLSSLVSTIQVARTSFGRIRDFTDPQSLQSCVQENSDAEPGVGDNSGRAELHNVTLGWADEKHILSNVNMNALPRSLVTISGAVGSGKSAIVNTILGVLKPAEGRVQVHGSISYMPQDPWLMDGTIRENILFGTAFVAARYQEVILASCLREDLLQLPDGDQTILGGALSLSGGQKARICLARTAYSYSDLCVLDDPLSALDVKVQRHVINHMLGVNGMLRNRTRIVITNSLNAIAAAEKVYVIKDGTLKETEQDLLDLDNDESGFQLQEIDHNPDSVLDPTIQTHLLEVSERDVQSKATVAIQAVAAQDEQVDKALFTLAKAVVRNSGNELSKTALFTQWARLASIPAWIVVILLVIFTRVSSLLSTYCLRMAADKTTAGDPTKDLLHFAFFALMQVFGFFLFILSAYILCMLPAALSLHKRLVNSIMGAPMSFFESQPNSRILNRFTNDLSRTDMSLNVSVIQLAVLSTDLVIVSMILLWSNPVSIFFLVPLMVVYLSLQSRYLVTSRHIKEIEVNTRAPMITAVQEAELAKVLFKVFRQTVAQKEKMAELIKVNLRGLIALLTIDIWLAVRLEILST